jgi:uncharacterized protein (TIGR02217 family)
MSGEFLNDRFFEDIRPVMSGGARFATEIKRSRSGHEFRNRRWQDPLREYSLSLGSRPMDEVLDAIDFAYKTSGSWKGFRLKDWFDYKSGFPNAVASPYDQSLGTGDGTTYYFRLNKSYGGGAYVRRITKPLEWTIRVLSDSDELERDVDYFVDDVNGTVVFKDAPTSGKVLKWGGEFDVPVRFEEDIIETLTNFYATGQTGSIALREVRIKENIDEASYTTKRAALP